LAALLLATPSGSVVHGIICAEDVYQAMILRRDEACATASDGRRAGPTSFLGLPLAIDPAMAAGRHETILSEEAWRERTAKLSPRSP
jgi:hypothetical protein